MVLNKLFYIELIKLSERITTRRYFRPTKVLFDTKCIVFLFRIGVYKSYRPDIFPISINLLPVKSTKTIPKSHIFRGILRRNPF